MRHGIGRPNIAREPGSILPDFPHRQYLFSFPQPSRLGDLLLSLPRIVPLSNHHSPFKASEIIYLPLSYGIVADTSFEYALSLPLESTAVVT
jgi:hypothetical protein